MTPTQVAVVSIIYKMEEHNERLSNGLLQQPLIPQTDTNAKKNPEGFRFRNFSSNTSKMSATSGFDSTAGTFFTIPSPNFPVPLRLGLAATGFLVFKRGKGSWWSWLVVATFACAVGFESYFALISSVKFDSSSIYLASSCLISVANISSSLINSP